MISLRSTALPRPAPARSPVVLIIADVARVVEIVELPLDPFGVLGALPGLVQLQRFPPDCLGPLVLAEGGVQVAQPVEGAGDFEGVSEVAEQGEGLLVVADGLVVVASVVLDVGQAV